MSLDQSAPVIAGLYEDDAESIEEQALWSAFRYRLQKVGAQEGLLQLRMNVSCRLDESKEERSFTRHKFKILQNISNIDVTYNANTDERCGYMISALMSNSTARLGYTDCLKIAEQEAKLPNDARLEFAEFQEVGDDKIFVARWHHYHENIWVEADYIQVMVNADTGLVFGYQRNWHNVSFNFAKR